MTMDLDATEATGRDGPLPLAPGGLAGRLVRHLSASWPRSSRQINHISFPALDRKDAVLSLGAFWCTRPAACAAVGVLPLAREPVQRVAR